MRLAAALVLVWCLALAGPARAQQSAPPALENLPAQADIVENKETGERAATIRTALGLAPTGFDDWAERRGISYRVVYTNEVLANRSGGLRRDTILAGKLEGILAIDLGRLAGLSGLTFYGNAFQIHDTGGLRDRTFSRLVTVSNIEAYPATRLSELWLEQSFGGGIASLRAGQLTADGEFFASTLGGLFISNDWPTITGANLPSGGPAYPVSTPGLRLKLEPNENVTALAAIFNGDPGDQRYANRDGLRFPLNRPALLMGEVQVGYNRHKDAGGLAGTWRLGGYHHLGRFADLRRDSLGLSLADPESSGLARRLRGSSGIYGVVDHQVYRPQGGGPEDGVGIYARVAASPSDRSLIDLWADGGIVFSGLVPGRPDDRFGVSVIYARLSDGARGADRDARIFTGAGMRLRSYEATLEATYAAQILPGWIVQPDIQYVFRPGGGILDPDKPGATLKGGLVLGLRSTLAF